MIKFAANLSMLFTEVPFMERFSLARDAGFSFVEYMFPYDFRAKDIKEKLDSNHLKQILFNLPAGNWIAGDRGIAAQPRRIEEFRNGVSQAIRYALELDVRQINCQVGKRVLTYDYEEQWAVLVDNVRYAADMLHENGLRLVIEPINHFDIPGFLLNQTKDVLKLLDEVGRENVFLQYDVYHAQREEGEIVTTLRQQIHKIAHIQIADNPGRHQPGTGEINYSFILKEIESLHYDGYIGLEYVPIPDSKSSFDWISQFGYKL